MSNRIMINRTDMISVKRWEDDEELPVYQAND
jgi:hypothetical protein